LGSNNTGKNNPHTLFLSLCFFSFFHAIALTLKPPVTLLLGDWTEEDLDEMSLLVEHFSVMTPSSKQ
jgi:hypothetical protein